MSTPTAPASPAGWFADPHTPGTLRYYDGAAWTHHVAQLPTSAAPAQGGLGADPADPVHWLLPTGRTWQSIAAGYTALFATVIWVLGPVALGLGVWALRASNRSGAHGRGRATFAIVVGCLATLATVAFIAAGALGSA